MRPTTRTIARAYLVGSIWFAAMLATALVWMWRLEGVFTAMDLGPVVSTSAGMAIAFIVATLVAGTLWMRLRPQRLAASVRD